MSKKPADHIADEQARLATHGYIADKALATVLYLARTLQRPLLLEGEAGVGKTQIAVTCAAMLACPLLRLQCYDGIDAQAALYEWNYPKQMAAMRFGRDGHGADIDIFGADFILRRPLLQALENGQASQPSVLLIDELDRADEPFEAFLLEILADYQITIPEYGTIRAVQPPLVFVTSNRTRDIHDAVKRRCLYHWVDYPSPEQEMAILAAQVPEAPEKLRQSIAAFVRKLREDGLFKAPGVAESIEWARALIALDQTCITPESLTATLGVLVKYQEDAAIFTPEKIAALTTQ